MKKKFNLLAFKQASSRNLKETRPLPREASYKKTIKESSFTTLKYTNEHLKVIIESKEPFKKEEIFSEMINILKKSQNERNQLDIKFLIFATSNIKFFQKTAMEMGRKTYENICNFIDYAYSKAGDVIFNLGFMIVFFLK